MVLSKIEIFISSHERVMKLFSEELEPMHA